MGGRVRAPVGKKTKNGNVALQTVDLLGVRAVSIVLHRVRACHHKIKVGRAFIYGDNLVTPPFIKKRRVKNITFSGSHLSTAHPLPSHGDIPGQMHQSTASTETSCAGGVHRALLLPSSPSLFVTCKGKMLLRLLRAPLPRMRPRNLSGACACRPEPLIIMPETKVH